MYSADQCSMLVLFVNLSFLLFVLGCLYRGAVTYRTMAFSPLVVSVVIPLVTLIFSIIFSSLRYSMIDLRSVNCFFSVTALEGNRVFVRVFCSTTEIFVELEIDLGFTFIERGIL